MEPESDIRWKQRFEHFKQAFLFLHEACNRTDLDALGRAGLIKAFELTFELGWKVLKDELDVMGFSPKSPRDVIKTAFSAALITDGHLWMEMLESRNLAAHVYDQEDASVMVGRIKERYLPPLQQVNDYFSAKG